MRKSLLVLILLVLCAHLPIIAGNWNAGYVIRLNGDTLAGLIQNQDTRSYSLQCYFKAEPQSKSQTFTPAELKGYRLGDGRYFVSRAVTISGHKRVCFLEFLVKGKLNIYHLQTDSSRYYAEKDSNLYELKDSEVKLSNDNATYIKRKKEYIGLLSSLMADGNMNDEIVQTDLRGKTLIRLACDYHDRVCTSEKCVIYERKSTPLLLRKAIVLGASLNQLNFGQEIVVDGFKITPLAGLRFELEHAIEWSEKISISLDCYLQYVNKCTLKSESDVPFKEVKYNGKSYYLYKISVPNQVIDRLDVDMKALMIRLPLAFNYYLNQTDWRPYFGLGAVGNFVVSQNKQLVIEPIYTEMGGQSIPFFQLGYTGRVGLKHTTTGKLYFFAELEYDNTRNMNINQFLRVKNENISLSFGVGF